MSLLSLIIIAIALGIDAFAVAAAAGVAIGALRIRPVFRMSFHFGLFQAFMPVIGWIAGTAVQSSISAFDHWIAFGLLAFVGVKMMLDARKGDPAKSEPMDPTRGWSLLLLSVATSIDALAVGISLAVLGHDIRTPALLIGVTAALLTVAGMTAGRWLGNMMGKKVEVFGGVVLIGIGIKIMIEHMS